jgi:hypothetical protein
MCIFFVGANLVSLPTLKKRKYNHGKYIKEVEIEEEEEENSTTMIIITYRTRSITN